MKELKNISDVEEVPTEVKTRVAARAIVIDSEGKIPLLFVSKKHYHKLPGGGVEEGEDEIQGLHREIKEETGCVAKIDGEVGIVREYRSKWNLLQTSHCFHGKVLSKGEPEFTQKELCNGFEIVWLTLDEAIETIKDDSPEDYEGQFVVQRDLCLLEAVKELRDK